MHYLAMVYCERIMCAVTSQHRCYCLVYPTAGSAADKRKQPQQQMQGMQRGSLLSGSNAIVAF